MTTLPLGGSRRRLLQFVKAASFSRWIWAFVFLPTLLTAIYYFLLAADQYESEAKFVVRSAQRSGGAGAFSFLVELGLQRSQDDSFVVEEFMKSRSALRQLQQRLPLRDMFKLDGFDYIAGYPSVLYGMPEERFYKYFQSMISVIHTDRTGVTSITVRAFSAADAKEIADTLLDLGEELVNKLNERIMRDAVSRGQAEVAVAQNRVIVAQTALTGFRNRELLIDPMNNAAALGDLIARLSTELAETRAQITESKMNSASSPLIPIMERKAAALDQQILSERSRIAENSDGLADRLATYERLTLEREFANKMLASNEAELVRASEEARKQMLYVSVVVGPNLADKSTQPRRIANTVTIFAGNLILLSVVWLIMTGIREHGTRA